jgi:hypothetical protein
MENTDTLDETVNTLSRTADIMDAFSLKIAEASKDIDDSRKQISGEVTILRACNKEIENTIANSVLESIDPFADRAVALIKPFLNQQIERVAQSISKLEKEQTHFLNILKNENERHKKKLSRVGLAICISFCVGSIGSGLGLWYLFPQTSILKIDLTADQRRQMEHGALLQFALPKLPKKEQDKLWSLMGDSWKEYYEKMFNVKFPRKQ